MHNFLFIFYLFFTSKKKTEFYNCLSYRILIAAVGVIVSTLAVQAMDAANAKNEISIPTAPVAART